MRDRKSGEALTAQAMADAVAARAPRTRGSRAQRAAPRFSRGSVCAAAFTVCAHLAAFGVALYGPLGNVSVDAPEQAGVRVQLHFLADTAVEVTPAPPARPAKAGGESAPPAQPRPVPVLPLPAERVTAPVTQAVALLPAAAQAFAPDNANEPPPLRAPATSTANPGAAQTSPGGGAASASVAPSSTAGAPPAGVTDSSWALAVMKRLEKFRTYPAAARNRRAEGVVLVQASIAPDGKVLDARVRVSCGDLDLDAEAVATFQRAGRVPPPPGGLTAPLQVDVPVDFHLS